MNKKDIALDTKSQAGCDILLLLTENAGVFLTNNRPQALKGMGLDYDTLKAKFPRLVYACSRVTDRRVLTETRRNLIRSAGLTRIFPW